MSSAERPNQEERMNAYIDHEMTPEERARFEQEWHGDPKLGSEMQRWREIEDRLTGMFGPSSVEALPIPEDEPSRFVISRRSALLALAACLAIVASVRLFQANLTPEPATFTVSELYARLSSPLEPQVVCDTPEKLLAYTAEHLGTPFSADFEAGVTLVGWRSMPRRGYIDKPGERAKILLAEAEDATPIVAVVYEPGAYRPNKRRSADVRTFEGRIGDLRILEITTLDEPRLIGLFREGTP